MAANETRNDRICQKRLVEPGGFLIVENLGSLPILW